MAYIVAVYLEKGGSTKTTTTVHLAHGFALNGLKTLVIDLDAQRHSSKWLKPDGVGDGPTIHEVVAKPETLAASIVPSRLENVDLIYGSRVLPMIAESALKMDANGQMRNQTAVLKRALRGVPPEYQVVFIDCPPSVSILNTNALAAADHVLVPLDIAELSYEGFKDVATTLVQMFNNEVISTIPDMSVLLTLLRGGEKRPLKITREIREKVLGTPPADGGEQEKKPYHVFERVVRDRSEMRRIYEQKKTAFELTGNVHDVADDYEAVAREFAQIIVGKLNGASAA